MSIAQKYHTPSPTAPTQEAVNTAVIVPVYNSAATLADLIARLHTALSSYTQDYTIILVDDRGPQDVWPIIQKACEDDARVRGIRLSRNFGQHAAISAGMAYAHAQWYVVMDCDLQDRPEDIPKLYHHAVEGGFASVIARRNTPKTQRRRKFGSMVFNTMLKHLADIPASEHVGNFRIFNHTMAEAYGLYSEKMRLFPAIMSHLGFNDGFLELDRPDREEGQSSYTFSKLFVLAFDSIISNTIKPMYYLAAFGIVISFLAVFFAVFIAFQKIFFGVSVTGWASLMAGLMLMGGVQIFVISFVGIYVGKVFFEVKDRPVFIIERGLNL